MLKRISLCRHCGARLVEASEKCWYCHRTLTSNDIITAGAAGAPYASPAEPQAEKQSVPIRTSRPEYGLGDAVEDFFRRIFKILQWCFLVAVWFAILGAILYGLVRFVHWAWYQ